jgi:D-threonate/D-erythronate kinase
VTRVAIIADDLTGALDTASPFACRGAKTLCFTNPDAIDLNAAADADVISVSTNSRHMAPHLAAENVRIAAEKIRELSPDIVLKKVDSRLKGNVREEADAVADIFGFERMLVAPAAPDIGRFVLQGAIVGAGVEIPISVASRFSGSALHFDIPDITSSDAMKTLALVTLDHKATLTVCSRGFAVAVAECLFSSGVVPSVSLETPHLVAIGSRDPITTEQQKAICGGGAFVCVEAPEGKVPEQLPSTVQLLIHCTGSIQGSTETVAKRFAEGVVRAATTLMPATVLCSGGDTASAVLRTFGQSFLQVLGEAAPGLPMSRITLGQRELIFISKSGGFGGPSTLLEVFANQQGNTRLKAHEFDGPQHSHFQN